MPNPNGNSAAKIVRFGAFAANLAAGELRKNGVRIRLQEQPFQVLALLLERPSEVVTREDLRQKLSMSISELDLSVRSANCLSSEKIETIGELVSRSEGELLKVRNFGKTSLREVKKKLSDMSLGLGMDLEAIFGKKPAPF